MLKITAGRLKGKGLESPVDASIIRPTAAPVREAMFNLLQTHTHMDGLTVLDMFCGTGALGLEALSRGAASVTFVDQSPALAQRNAATCNMTTQCHFITADATQPLPITGPYDVIFLDPPYHKKLAQTCLQANHSLGKPGTLWVVETEPNGGGAKLAFSGPFDMLAHKIYGERSLTLLKSQ